MLPTAILVVLVDIALHQGIPFPLPFILLLCSVAISGSLGGFWVGIGTGTMASAMVFHTYLNGFGPEEFTGSPVRTALGVFVFLLVAGLLGWLRDRSDKAIANLITAEQALAASVRTTSQARDKAAAKISEQDEQLRHAVRLSGLGFFKWDALTGNCEICSERHANHFGLTPEEFQRVTSGPEPYTGYVHEEDREAFLEAIARVDDGEALPFDYRIIRPDGQIRYIRQINEPVFDEDGREIAVIGSSLDFTELHESEVQLRRSQRIEAIGNLTGGVAHDFNNLLAVIMGNLEMLLLTNDRDARTEMINEALEATQRGADLTKSLLSFARRAHLTPSRINLNKVVNTTLVWASRVLPETISVETSLLNGLWETKLDPASTENAIINLLLNARDAMSEGGQLTLETSNVQINNDHISNRNEEIEPGRYVMLAVSDTGHGIKADKLERIFEPFYTDKPVGAGTGLGLSMVEGFIKQSKGAIQVYSEEGAGTTFKLYFKAVDATATVEAENQASKPKSQPPGSLRILLAEDEEAVSRVLVNILKDAGHQVSVAATGDDALSMYKTSGPYDLLLTDNVMPGKLQGPALAKTIRGIDPQMPCVFLSGYAAEAPTPGNGLNPADLQLMKPTSREDLLDAVALAIKNMEMQSK